MAGRTKKLTELARVIRSKNAGPFYSTIDLFFDDEESYCLVRDSGVLTPEQLAPLWRIPPADVLGVMSLDSARGIKITIVKPGHVGSGDLEMADVFGCQQYVPLLGLQIPVP